MERARTNECGGVEERTNEGAREEVSRTRAANGCRNVSCHFDGNAMDVRYFV